MSSTWTSDELDRIGVEEELRIASERTDGTLSSDRIIWMVRVGDEIYIRSAHGTDAVWWRGTQRTHRGRISCAGIEKDVTFEDVGGRLNAEIDAAYRAKYRTQPQQYVTPVINEASHATTIRLVPR